MDAYLLVNPRAGTGLRAGEMDKLLTASGEIPGLEVLVLKPGQDARVVAQELVAKGARTIGIAGGDGTISSVANALVQTTVTLVPIAFGTKNHFCTDLGVHADPTIAVQAIAEGSGVIDGNQVVSHRIDVGCVNSLYFLDNSSLGLYPHLVKRRLKRHDKIGKWPAYFIAMIEMLRHPVRLSVEIPMEDGGHPTRVGLIFVSNNIMDAAWPTPGHRARMDEGLLQVFVLKDGGPVSVLRGAVSFLRGKTYESPLLNEHRVREFTVTVRGRQRESIRVSIDGEVHKAQPPIRYSILPRALNVRYIGQQGA